MLADHLSSAKLKKLAGSAVFARGEEYFNSAAVSRMKMADDVLSARVTGSYPYAVKLWEEDGGIEYECSCPHGEDGNFCKHCVAVGLAWLAETGTGGGAKSTKQKKNNPWKEITDFVGLQDAATLAEWQLETAKRDDVLYESLLIKARRAAGPASTIKGSRPLVAEARCRARGGSSGRCGSNLSAAHRGGSRANQQCGIRRSNQTDEKAQAASGAHG
jgi:hypothetical protein